MRTGLHIEGHASPVNEHTAAAIVAVARAIEAMAMAARVLAEKVAGEVGVANTTITGATIGDTPAARRVRKPAKLIRKP